MRNTVLLALTSTALMSCRLLALDWDTVPGNSTADGGSGVWDLTTPNWFNGTGNVPWNSSSATFGGAHEQFATIRVPSGGVQVTSLTFNSRMTIAADEDDGDLLDDMLLPTGMIPINGSQLARIFAPIGGAGGIETFTQTALFSDNTYSGGTNIRSSVNALSRSALGTGPVVLHSGNLSYSSAPFGTISNKFTFVGGTYTQFREGHTLSGEVVVQNFADIVALREFGQSGLTLSGPISGPASATFNVGGGDSCCGGPSTIRVTNTNPFEGTVRLGIGTLITTSDAGFPKAKLTLAGFNGANLSTLAGRGVVGDITVNGTAEISPGDGGVGTLTMGSFEVSGVQPSALFKFELGNVSDHVVVNGSLNFNLASSGASRVGLNAQFLEGFTPSVGDVFVLISNDSTDPIVGEFIGIAEGQNFLLGQNVMTATYKADAASHAFEGGNDFALRVEAIPEPASISLLGLGSAFLISRRRLPRARASAARN